MEKISFGIVGQRGESVLQLCAEKPLQIVIRIGQGLQRTIPQMQLHGGILHGHIDFAFAKRLPIVVRRKKNICLPAEHRRQLGRLTTRAPTPSPSSRAATSSAISTSEPVAMRITSGVPALSFST